jgi:hypothetical protein
MGYFYLLYANKNDLIIQINLKFSEAIFIATESLYPVYKYR